MQTFLPYPDFEASLRALDYRRLGKQRLEALQLIRAISGACRMRMVFFMRTRIGLLS